MTQPHNLARDRPGLPVATPGGGASSTGHLDGQLPINYLRLEGFISPERRHCPLQQRDKTTSGRTDYKNLSSQVKLAPHNTNSKNLLECRPPQCQEHSGAKKNSLEALSNLYELTFSSLGPTGHVNFLLNVKVISSYLFDP
jgi:hypothetical protein